MFTIVFFSLMVSTFLWSSASAVCPTSFDFETVVGGYNKGYDVSKVTFDVDTDTLDMVVAGQVSISGTDNSFVYYVAEDTCTVKWLWTE